MDAEARVGRGGNTEAASALSDMLSALPNTFLHDFLRDGGRDERIVFTCEMRDGKPLPLKHSDAAHPIWQNIDAKLRAGAVIGSGLVLENHLVFVSEAGSEGPVRIMVVPDTEILAALSGTGQDGALTDSELRLLKQLACGLTLPAAADIDGVSHETKRTQFKSLARKLKVRSQNALANKVLMHLLLDLDSALLGNPADSDDHFIALIHEFMPDARAFQLWSPRGTRHRFIDIGPVTGHPVALVHSIILPDIRPSDIALLDECGLRLIVPLRHGAMSKASSHLDIAGQLDHACEGIDLIRTQFGKGRVDVLATISGCAYGLEYARRFPDRMRSLTLVGAPINPLTDRSFAGRFRSGVFSLAAGHWGLFTRALQFYGRRIRRPDTLRTMLTGMYRSSPADAGIVQAEYASAHGGERGRMFMTASLGSLCHDLYHQAHPRWDERQDGAFPISFIHGTQDIIHPIAGIRARAKSWGGVPVHEISGAGQLLYHQHFEPMTQAYRRFLDGVTD